MDQKQTVKLAAYNTALALKVKRRKNSPQDDGYYAGCAEHGEAHQLGHRMIDALRTSAHPTVMAQVFSG
jgi:hypothetical protein